jgi:hypothetical protein
MFQEKFVLDVLDREFGIFGGRDQRGKRVVYEIVPEESYVRH